MVFSIAIKSFVSATTQIVERSRFGFWQISQGLEEDKLKQIKDELAKQGYKIEKSSIELTNNISSLGFHNVDLELYNDVIAVVKVHVIK